MMKRLATFISFSLILLLTACGAGESPPTSQPAPIELPTLTPTAPAATATTAPAPTTPPATESNPISTSPPPTPTPSPTVVVFPPHIQLKASVMIPEAVTYLTHAGDGSGRLFVTGKSGVIWVVADGDVRRTPFLDISDLVDSGPSERGLLSVAFDPGFVRNGFFYVNYTSKVGDGDTVIARYHTTDLEEADPATGEELLRIDQPAANHNGGQLQFGPDGYLYIGMGDGGSAGDPWDNAENLDALLGKMLRINVSDEDRYAIPAANPFVGRDDARPEIWAYGLRNPWRFSFDQETGDLYIADVGQNLWEEIDFQPAGSLGGEHYGWNTMEGNHCYDPPENCDTSGKVPPVWEYPHPEGCSITGGYVYRGRRYPQLQGIYFYADFCSGQIYALRKEASGGWQSKPALETGLNIASFGEDEAGELYVLDLGGDIYMLTASD